MLITGTKAQSDICDPIDMKLRMSYLALTMEYLDFCGYKVNCFIAICTPF